MTVSRHSMSIVEQAAVSAATALGFYLMARFWNHRLHVLRLEKEVEKLQVLLERERVERKAERIGRIRAEQSTTKLKLEMASPSSSTTPSMDVSFPFRPIGYAQSCFSQRNGTPRQPGLCDKARCLIQLSASIPSSALDGLQDYSHCWILYVFHENNDLAKVWAGDRQNLKAKIAVPRLNGGKKGVFATRSPHRPSPIGLSCAKVILVDAEKGFLVLGGADVVNGSPILDIKPYVSFCDAIEAAQAPGWVSGSCLEDEPLAISSVAFAPGAVEMITQCWSQRSSSLYPDSDSFLDLVAEVLSRDLRPVHRRIPSPSWSNELSSPAYYDNDRTNRIGGYHVVLEGIDVSYDMEEGRVIIRGAVRNVVESQQRGLGLLNS